MLVEIFKKNEKVFKKKIVLDAEKWLFQFSKFYFFPLFYNNISYNYIFYQKSQFFDKFLLPNRTLSMIQKLVNSDFLVLINSTWISSKVYYFCEFRIVGLGFKVKRIINDNSRSLRFEIGLGHYIYYSLPPSLKCIKRKKKFVLFSYDLILLNIVIRHIEFFKLLNPYKLRGLKNLKRKLKVKEGKKQVKK